MQFVGNLPARQIMDGIASRIASRDLGLSFVLIVGPQHIGKTTLIEQTLTTMQQTTTPPLTLDIIRHYETNHTKPTSIKIEGDPRNELGIAHGHTIYNYGVRELTARLATTSIADAKVICIESIDRLTTSAANAFLKTLEEAPDDTIIFATASSTETLLPTIVSRAMIVRMDRISDNEIMTYLTTDPSATDLNLTDTQRDAIMTYSCGQIGTTITLLQMEPDKRQEILTQTQTLIRYLDTPTSYTTLTTTLHELSDSGLLSHARTILEKYALTHNLRTLSTTLKKTKQLLSHNVSLDNALMYLAAQLAIGHH